MKVFLSYSRQNAQPARQLYSTLKTKGVDVWFDRESLIPGREWEPAIKRALLDCDTVLLLLSLQSVDRRGFFQKEMRLALDVMQTVPAGHIYLLPIRLDDCSVPDSLAAIQYVDLFPNYDDGVHKVLSALEIQQRLRSKIQERSSRAELSTESKATILIVNDAPSTINAFCDHLRSIGLTVNHAFSVPQAIRFIDEHHPDVIISDLTHLAFGVEVTNRAAFEILEWCAKHAEGAKVIVTCAIINDERRQEATMLGATGICNDSGKLYQYLSEAIGIHISDPFQPARREHWLHEAARDSIDTPRSRRLWGPTYSICLMLYDKDDVEFTKKLAQDLEANGINVQCSGPPAGDSLYDPLDLFLKDGSDCVLFLLPRNAAPVSWLDGHVYKAGRNPRSLVIAALLHDGVQIPPLLRTRMRVDFRKGYEKGLSDLFSLARSRKPMDELDRGE
jgi:CheY-like chemotaxis protein